MKNLACYVATNLYDWGMQDIEDMVEQVGCVETVVDFLEDKIEWAWLAEE